MEVEGTSKQTFPVEPVSNSSVLPVNERCGTCQASPPHGEQQRVVHATTLLLKPVVVEKSFQVLFFALLSMRKYCPVL